MELLPILMGSASGVIGSSALGLILGGIYLLLRGGITWEIPASMIATTWLFLVIFGGHGFAPAYILPQLLGGGLLMAAFFMATDPGVLPLYERRPAGLRHFCRPAHRIVPGQGCLS